MIGIIGDEMKKVVDIAHDILQSYIKDNCIAVDFTMGQGYDTLFFAQNKHVQQVFAFDIQQDALQQTKQKLQECGVNQKVMCILDGHEHCKQYIESFDIGVFNFGYLPKGDASITTQLVTSKQAVEQALSLLQKHGCLVLVLYPGHEQGVQESLYFDTWTQTLSSKYYSVLYLKMHNKKNAPYIIAIEKVR